MEHSWFIGFYVDHWTVYRLPQYTILVGFKHITFIVTIIIIGKDHHFLVSNNGVTFVQNPLLTCTYPLPPNRIERT